jgi:Ca2+-binding EF-hand superfamily protein
MNGFDTMKQAFQAVDRDCSGTVERGELARVFESFHVGHSEADLEDLFAEYDKNGDGVFTYGEFVKIMSNHKPQ